MSEFSPSPFEIPNSIPWHYKWVEITLRLHSYIRYRMEDTMDGMGQPYTETLAYVQDIGIGEGWEWRALRHVDDKVSEMDIPGPLPYRQMTIRIEEVIRQELGADRE